MSMRRVAILFSCLVLSGLTVRGQAPKAAQKPEEPQRPTFRTEANFVRVDVYPTKGGVPVTDLSADDFEILEDGARQKIETFEYVRVRTGMPQEERAEPNTIQESRDAMRDPRARVFVLFLDANHVTIHGSWNIREPLVRLIDRLLAPDDLVGIMTPKMSARDIVFARKTQVIAGGLRDIWPWGERFTLHRDQREQDWEMCYSWPEHKPVLRAMLDRKRERETLQALRELVNFLRYEREERKAIVTISEGWALYRPDERITTPVKDPLGNTEPIPGPEPIAVGPDGRIRLGVDKSNANIYSMNECHADRLALSLVDHDRVFKDIMDDANRANASFYTVDPRGLAAFDAPIGPDPPPTLQADYVNLRGRLESLQVLAANTDGLSVINSNDLDRGLRRISDDLTSYYLLGYYTSNAKLDGRFRQIKVKVNRPGIDIRARRGYRAPTREEVTAAREAAAAPVPESIRGAQSALESLARIRPGAKLSAHAVAVTGDTPMIWVTGQLAKAAPAAAAASITVTGGGETLTETATIPVGGRSFTTAIPLKAGFKGPLDVRVRVTQEGDPIPLSDMVRLEAVSGLAYPVLYRRGPSTGNRLEPAGEPVFSRTERARFEIPAAGDAKLHEARLLDRSGTDTKLPITLSERTDATTGQRWLTADLTLAPLGAGDYIVEFSGSAAGTSHQVLTAIRVTR